SRRSLRMVISVGASAGAGVTSVVMPQSGMNQPPSRGSQWKSREAMMAAAWCSESRPEFRAIR
ncbi:MAG: hypothetical protein NTU77_14325, partial [Actinobacteria bacterium]|nr:hypothetical protein [Actinomycetota bacterium]